MEETYEKDFTQEDILNWIKYCENHPKVNLVKEDVPLGILKDGVHGILIDAKVKSSGGHSEDDVYLEYPGLQNRVARGNFVLKMTSNGKVVYKVLGQGLRKFGGELDESDDYDDVTKWTVYFKGALETLSRVIVTSKENGESAHISIPLIDSQQYFCFGSKNVHVLTKTIDDIEKYYQPKYAYARCVAHTFFKSYWNNPSITCEKKAELRDFMQKRKLTIVAELLNPMTQHIVHIGHLKEPELRFICWTKATFVDDQPDAKDHYVPMPLDIAIDKASGFGLFTVSYQIYHLTEDRMNELINLIRKIRGESCTEGKVVYCEDQYSNTLGLIKSKTCWYYFLRAIRERVKYFQDAAQQQEEKQLMPVKASKDFRMKRIFFGIPCKEFRHKSIRNRLEKFESWLGVNKDYIALWTQVAIGFSDWLAQDPNRFEDPSLAIDFLMPVTFQQFCNQVQEINDTYIKICNVDPFQKQ